MIDAPSNGAPEQAPRWGHVDTESYGGGIRVLAPYLIVWGYVGIYRKKEYVSGATGGPPRVEGAPRVGRRAPLPRGCWEHSRILKFLRVTKINLWSHLATRER